MDSVVTSGAEVVVVVSTRTTRLTRGDGDAVTGIDELPEVEDGTGLPATILAASLTVRGGSESGHVSRVSVL